MNILWLARTMPFPVDAGDRTYSVGLATALAAQVAGLKVLAIAPPGSIELARAQAPQVEWSGGDFPLRSRVRSLLHSRPLVSAMHSPEAWVERVRRELQDVRYDALVLDQYALGWVLEELSALIAAKGLRVVYIGHNDEAAVARDTARAFRGNPVKKAMLHLNAVKIRRMEAALLKQADLVTVISDEDATVLRGRGTQRAPLVLRPGLDHAAKAPRVSPGTPRWVTVVGSYTWIPKQMNLSEFLAHCVPLLQRAGIGLDVIGAMPDDFRQRLAAAYPSVGFLGFVDDIDSTLAGYRMGLNIERTGGGFKLKNLTYVAAGLPVAALADGLTGVPPELKDSFLVRDDLTSLVAAIAELIDDDAALQGMARGATAVVNRLYNWERSGEVFAAALAGLPPRDQVGAGRASKPTASSASLVRADQPASTTS